MVWKTVRVQKVNVRSWPTYVSPVPSEQDADMVCFIHRPEYYKITEDERVTL